MAVLTNKSIASTYTSLLSIGSTSTSSLGSSIQSLTDGTGQLSPLAMSTTQIQFNTSTNTFLFPSTRGTINQILKLTDANGTLAWGDDNVSNQLDTAGNSGTGSVTLDSQSLTLTGTTNEITTNANAQSISIGFPTAGVTLPNNSIATTQLASDTSTKIATTKYVTDAIGDIVIPTGDVTKTGTITANQIAVWNDSTDELRSDETVTIGTDHSITLLQKNSLDDDRATYNIGGGNIDDVTGQNNVGFGKDNLGYLVSGQDNNAFGNNSQISNSSGSYNTSFGNQTLNYHSSSDYNVAIGYQSLRGDNIGGTPSSDNNTAIGTFSLRLVDGGNSNTAIGINSGSAITTGSNNVIIGSFTGFRAAVVGGLAEYSIITSNNNIVISDGVGNVRQSFDSNGDATFDGNVGIGTSGTPSAVLEVYAGSDSTANTILWGETIRNAANASTVGYGVGLKLKISSDSGNEANKWAGIAAVAGTSYANTTDLAFYTNAVAGNIPTEKMRISSGGDVQAKRVRSNTVGDVALSINPSDSTIHYGFRVDSTNNNLNLDNVTSSTNLLNISSGGAATFSGDILSNGGEIFSKISGGVTAAVVKIGSGATWQLRSNPITGTNSYGLDIISGVATPLVRLSISSAGRLTTATSDSTALELISTSTASSIRMKNTGTSPSDWIIQSGGGVTGALNFYSAVTGSVGSRFIISSAGDATLTTTTNEGGLTITSATDNTTLRLSNQQTGGKEWRLYSTGGTSGYGQGNFIIRNHNDSINALIISSGGEVGIGGAPLGGNGLRILTNSGATMADFRNTLSSGLGLYVAGATGGTNYSFRVADYNNSPRFTVFGNGSATLLGYLTEGGSDIRFKKNIEKIPNAIEKIKSINGYTFEWDKNNEYNFSLKEGKDVGVIAQEIEKVLPEVVSIAPIDREDDGKSKSGKNYLTVDYKKIVPLLIQGIKEQQTIIEDLKSRIETLEG